MRVAPGASSVAVLQSLSHIASGPPRLVHRHARALCVAQRGRIALRPFRRVAANDLHRAALARGVSLYHAGCVKTQDSGLL